MAHQQLPSQELMTTTIKIVDLEKVHLLKERTLTLEGEGVIAHRTSTRTYLGILMGSMSYSFHLM